jgi:hypothetical protein
MLACQCVCPALCASVFVVGQQCNKQELCRHAHGCLLVSVCVLLCVHRCLLSGNSATNNNYLGMQMDACLSVSVSCFVCIDVPYQRSCALQADDLRTVTLRWLQDQEQALMQLSAECNANSYEEVPGWLHGKSWSSPHQASIVCDVQQVPTAPPFDGQALENTFLAFPVLRSMAISQWTMNPDDFPISDDATSQNGANPIVAKRCVPARVLAAIQASVMGFLVRFQSLFGKLGLACVPQLDCRCVPF